MQGLDAGTLSAVITLPDHQELTAQCRVVYASGVDDETLVGVEFSGFEGDGLALWEAYTSDFDS